MSAAVKDPSKVAAGLAGAKARWGEPGTRVVRLNDLSAPERRIVLALLGAVRNEKATNTGPESA